MMFARATRHSRRNATNDQWILGGEDDQHGILPFTDEGVDRPSHRHNGFVIRYDALGSRQLCRVKTRRVTSAPKIHRRRCREG